MKRKFTRMVAMLLTVLILGSTFPTTSLAAIDSGSMPAIADSMPQEPAADPPQSISQPNTGDASESSSSSDSSDVESELTQSESTPAASESLPPESDSNSGSSSNSDSTSASSDTSNSDSDSANGSDSSSEPLEPEETAPFIPLEITDMSTTFSGKPGDVVDFFVTLNREDVQVKYQWQRLYTGKSYDGEGVAIHDYGEGESTRYIFTLDGMSEEEILKMNPDATWPGIEMYYDQLEKANGDATQIDIAPNTPNYILDSEAAAAMNAGKPDTVCGVLVE